MHDTDADDRSALPPVVTPEAWQQARDALLVHLMFEPGEQHVCAGCSSAGWPQTPAYWRRLHDEHPSDDLTAAA
jgi:predicted dithiol-disulfide oxidoreductase (DUF899 family)